MKAKGLVFTFSLGSLHFASYAAGWIIVARDLESYYGEPAGHIGLYNFYHVWGRY